MIDVKGLVKFHGTNRVLNRVDFRVARGEVAAIIGPSGCGKSTFLRCLNGLEAFQEGTVSIDGIALRANADEGTRREVLKQVRSRVGMVFQSFNLFPHRTVLQNLTEAPIHVLGMGVREAEERARALLERVQMLDKMHSKPKELSGGQQQRVGIARAMAMQPEVILFDEPTSALDPVMTGEVLEVMRDLAGEGQTMIVVTHAMAFARRVANRVHMFHQGVIVESAPPDQFFQDPQSQETRVFLEKAWAA